eukprot:TRINITY_DN1848_c2_g3_i3.p1 TRINITY_DN1848_c2_g3~~TRINITY_DN1848_c2_g3_i3.p1  ORF type:complete len:105 (-),score=19.56 TRINITY_DN1848_c2_g3_i3:37-351(-)
MGNMICVMCHCNGRGERMLVGDSSHIYTKEEGCALSGVYARGVSTLPNGELDLKDMEEKIEQIEIRSPTTLVCLENTHSTKGGKPLSIAYTSKVSKVIAKSDKD